MAQPHRNDVKGLTPAKEKGRVGGAGSALRDMSRVIAGVALASELLSDHQARGVPRQRLLYSSKQVRAAVGPAARDALAVTHGRLVHPHGEGASKLTQRNGEAGARRALALVGLPLHPTLLRARRRHKALREVHSTCALDGLPQLHRHGHE